MRCDACGTEMLLVKVAPDHTMIVRGYERYTLQCLGCFEVKEHLIYNRERPSRLTEPAPSLSALTSACTEANQDLDESEALLKRAMEIVRAPTRSSRRVIRIEYNPAGETAYVAKDTETGHVLLRHNDRARLQVMCEQFQWQVVDGEVSRAEAEAPTKR
jgi:hypothetical protein